QGRPGSSVVSVPTLSLCVPARRAMLWFLESPEDPPPLPARSAVFVVRNGRYEPQNLMPVLPRMDILEFDGFVTRRGSAVGGLTARPPEMRQASLVSNPVSVRRDSVRARSDPSSDRVQFSMVLDTQSACTVSVHLLVTEVEQSQGPEGERRLELVPQAPQGPRPKEDHGAPEAPEDERPREGAPAAEGPPPWHGQLGALLDRRRFGAGLGQCYESPPLDLSQIPAEQLAFDVGRPADVPIAICLEPEGGSVEEVCAHYSYVSLQRATASSPKLDGCGDAAGAHWTAQVFAQKLQYQGNCFVLHDVFGVASKRASDYDGAETGSSECVICLSEPRDTAVLPCRHMCFCGYCAGIVRLQCEKCPVCRQKVKSLLQFKKEDAAMDQLMGIKPQERRASSARGSVS
ncbi:unnamed protein product, partial [Prorocentrum cordatum]